MNPDRFEFARALELACRHINPPHRPVLAPVRLEELDLDGLRLGRADPMLAYRYSRGLEWAGPVPSRLEPTALWAAERGLIEEASAAIEVEPGLVALGDVRGAVRFFARAERARWECVAVVAAHSQYVSAIVAVGNGEILSLALDGTVAACKRDSHGRWRLRYPAASGARPAAALSAACRVGKGAVIVGGAGGLLFELLTLPSGEWVEAPLPLSNPTHVIALCPWGNDGFIEFKRVGPPVAWARSSGGAWQPTSWTATNPETIADAVEWDMGVVALATQSGAIALIGPDTATVEFHRLSHTPFLALRALQDHRLATLSADGQVRLWAYNGGGFELQSEFESRADGPPLLAELCDGRLVHRDGTGVALAAPAPEGNWRRDETVSSIQGGIGAVASMGGDRLAFVDGGTRVVVATLKPKRDMAVEYYGAFTTTIIALAAVNPGLLALADQEGAIWLVRPDATGQWTRAAGPQMRGPIEQLAARDDWLAVANRDAPLAILRWTDGGLVEQAVTGAPRAAGAIAIDGSGRCAYADEQGAVHLLTPQASGYTDQTLPKAPGTGRIAALAWANAEELLALDEQGGIVRLRPGTSQVDFVRSALPWSYGARIAVADDGAITLACGLTVERLTAPVAMLRALHGDVKAIATQADRLLIGADALYVVDVAHPPAASANEIRLTPGADPFSQARIRRILVGDDWLLDAGLTSNGETRSIFARRRKSRAWDAVRIGAALVPDDPLLHELVALVDADGRLREIGTAKHCSLSDDRTIFRGDSAD